MRRSLKKNKSEHRKGVAFPHGAAAKPRVLLGRTIERAHYQLLSTQHSALSPQSSVLTLRRSAKVVLQAHDIVLAKIAAALDLDKDQRLLPGILHPMRRADGNVD